jgi:hypothetical protein
VAAKTRTHEKYAGLRTHFFLNEAAPLLEEWHGIHHSTVQIEISPEEDCSQAPKDKV